MIANDTAIALYKDISESEVIRPHELWHASSISQCPRAHYFKRLGIKRLPVNNPSAARLLRWGAGHHLETSIRPHIAKIYGEVQTNKRYTSEKLQLTGEFDNLVLSNSKLVEIKSVSDFAFIQRDNQVTLKEATGNLNKWGKPEYRPKETPYLGHELQNHAYVLLLKEAGIEVKEIDYVYISLNGRIVVYNTQVQQKLIDNVNARLAALQTAWDTQTPPPCICKPAHPLYDSVMQWCDWRDDENKRCCYEGLITTKVIGARNE